MWTGVYLLQHCYEGWAGDAVEGGLLPLLLPGTAEMKLLCAGWEAQVLSSFENQAGEV